MCIPTSGILVPLLGVEHFGVPRCPITKMKRIAIAAALPSAILTGALLAWWALPSSPSPPDVGVAARPVPTEATREAWLLASGLARRGVPTGLIAPHGVGKGHESGPGTAHSALADESTAGVLARFNRGSGEFAATEDDGIVHIRRRDQPALIDGLLTGASRQPALALPPLGLPADCRDVLAHPLGIVLNATGVLLWNGVFEDRGAVGSYLGGRPHCLDACVHVAAGEISPLHVLDAIARQHSDIFWIVTYDPDVGTVDDLRVGIVCPGGGGVLARSGRSRRRP